jgi:YidC/Oxa1 family membrane protein insertase
MEKQRFVIAILLSAVILFGWNLLFPIKTPQQSNTNSSTAQLSGSPAASPQPTAANTDQQASQTESAPPAPDNISPRTITVTTPLYDVKLESRGAVATSWILKKNKNNDRPLYSVAGSKDNPVPLELISQEGLKRETREAPLRLQTVDGDKTVDALLASRNYQINASGLEGDNLNIAAGESKSIEFVLQDEATKLDVRKIITFYADHYIADVKVFFKREDQTKPAKLVVGPSIGDQGIPEYNFYSVAPEGVAATGDEVGRFYAQSINDTEQSPGKQLIGGTIDWASVGDTYFTMIAVPSQKTEGLEYRTTRYEHLIPGDTQGRKESRYLITGYVPVPTDGSLIRLYTGPKDHYLLNDASQYVSQAVQREVDLEGTVDYGFLGSVSRPLAVPILWSIKHLHRITGSYGVAIIIFTIIIYSLFFPLKWRSSKAMKKAQKLAPQMKELQEKIKGMKKTDPRLRDLQMEQMRLMKEGNPLGGCLPLLIQLPFLFALFRAITISIDFRQASFLWIPDLSAAEPTTIPILPILMAGSMMVLQLITPAPSADPLQRKMMAIGMPLLMLWMLWSAPAGLLVYWLVGNIVGFGQQFLINHLTKTKDDEQPPSEKKAETRSTKKLKTARVSQA